MNSFWNTLRDSVKPTAEFREKLKADILEQTLEKEFTIFEKVAENIVIPEPRQKLSIQRKLPAKPSVWKSFGSRIQEIITFGAVRWGMMLGGVALASFTVLPVIVPYFSPPTQASQETIIRNIEGTVAITRNNTTKIANNGGNIIDGDTVITGDNSNAEVIFFNGTIIRVSSNSKLVFDELSPHPFLVSSGGISVSLEEGVVWMKTFSLSSENSQVSIQTNNLTVIPSRTAFLLQYKNGVNALQVWENSATVVIKGLNVDDSIVIRENESLTFSPFDKISPKPSYLAEKTDFVNQNLEKDKSYTKEFLERITAQMKEEYIMNSLSSQIHSYLSNNNDPDSVEYLISQLNNLILVARNTREEEPSPSSEETSTKYLPVISAKSQQASNPKLSSKSPPEISSTPSAEPQVFPVNNLHEEEKTAQELGKEYQAKQQDAYREKVSKSFVEQVNQFSFPSSRKTKAKNLLNNLPSTEDSLSIIQKIESIAPDDIKEEVSKKREEIEKKVMKNAAPSPTPTPEGTVSSAIDANKTEEL